MEQKAIVVIPTYNEVSNIGTLIETLLNSAPSISVLVVDDNSSDGTGQKVKKLQGLHQNLSLIVRDKKLGLGSAYIEGFKYALEKGYEVVGQMDADLSHAPCAFLKMLDLAGKYDLVIGSRYVEGGGIKDWALFRVLLSRFANLFSKAMLNVPISDSTSGFKCARRSVLEGIDFNTISSKGYGFQIEMVYRSFLKGFKITEYPIVFQGRKNERSKMSLFIAVEAFFRVITLSFLKLLSRRKNTKEGKF